MKKPPSKLTPEEAQERRLEAQQAARAAKKPETIGDYHKDPDRKPLEPTFPHMVWANTFKMPGENQAPYAQLSSRDVKTPEPSHSPKRVKPKDVAEDSKLKIPLAEPTPPSAAATRLSPPEKRKANPKPTKTNLPPKLTPG